MEILLQLDSRTAWRIPLPSGMMCCKSASAFSSRILIDRYSSLWCGPNPRPGLTTFSWVAQSNVTSFSHDYSPLIQALLNSGKLPSNTYLGVVGFGQEAFTAPDNVTLAVTNFGATVNNSLASFSAAFSFATSLLCIAIFLSHVVYNLT